MKVKSLKVVFFGMIVFQLMIANGLAQPKKVPDTWPKNVNIASASIGGATYLHASGFAKLLYEKMGIPVSVEVGAGSAANVKIIQGNMATFGCFNAPTAYEGWEGLGWAKGKKHQDTRVIAHMNNTYFQIYALKKSGIKSIYDLNGKSIGVGPVGGAPHTLFPALLKALGIEPSRYANAGISDLDSNLRDGMLDANANVTSVPWVTVMEIETVLDVNVFGVSSKDFEKAADFKSRYPFTGFTMIPKGTYKSNKDMDIETGIFGSFYAVHKSLPDDFVYEVVKKYFENIDIVIATHASAKQARVDGIMNSPVPLHPGAIKYYKEVGLKIPERLIPKD
ncbi:MAG: TAXI family TRAP transporter solute-binding subunit [Desulfobacterales bacterium]|nr:TAXI family TRAP transporter solute-binding subunit [Desulfobacterales bacterium]